MASKYPSALAGLVGVSFARRRITRHGGMSGDEAPSKGRPLQARRGFECYSARASTGRSVAAAVGFGEGPYFAGRAERTKLFLFMWDIGEGTGLSRLLLLLVESPIS